MIRAHFDELDPSDDFLLMCHMGEPFSGIAFEDSNEGRLLTETHFLSGQKSGVTREWSSNGTLVREQRYALNALHGPSREWFENGTPKLDGEYELGVCIRETEWDELGRVIREYRIDKASPQFAILEKLRASHIATFAK